MIARASNVFIQKHFVVTAKTRKCLRQREAAVFAVTVCVSARAQNGIKSGFLHTKHILNDHSAVGSRAMLLTPLIADVNTKKPGASYLEEWQTSFARIHFYENVSLMLRADHITRTMWIRCTQPSRVAIKTFEIHSTNSFSMQIFAQILRSRRVVHVSELCRSAHYLRQSNQIRKQI